MAPNEVATAEVSQLQSFNRVAEIPVVKSALAIASDQYEKLKGYSMVGSSLMKAEQTVQYVAESAKPVVSKLEKQLSFADSIMCQGLDKLEEKVPALKKSTDELKIVGWEKVDSIKAYGYDRVNDALHSPYALAVIKSMDTAMDLTEHAVDHYLPASEGESHSEDAAKEGQNVVQRMGNLSEKMRLRMYKQALSQIEVLQKRSEEAIDMMKHSVDLIAYARSLEHNGLQSAISGSLETVQHRAKALWDELNKEQTAAENGEAQSTIDQQILAIARRTTREVMNRYNQLGDLSHVLPESIQLSLSKSTDYAKDVYTQLSNASSLKDVSDIALKQVSSALESMQQYMSHAKAAIANGSSSSSDNESETQS